MDWKDSLFEKQENLEALAHERGVDRFRRRLEEARKKGRAATHGAALKLLKEGIEPLEKAITWMVEEKKRGRPHMAIRWCREIGPSVAAYLTAKVCLDRLYERVTFRKASLEISNAILYELRQRRYREVAPALWEWKIRRFQGTDNEAHKRRSLRHSFVNWKDGPQVDVSDLTMTTSERLLVGGKLIDLFIGATGMIESSHEHRSGKRRPTTEVLIGATEETLTWLGHRNDAMQDFWPVCMPMVVPPLSWSPEERGGYRYALRGELPFVRTLRGNEDPEWLSEADIPEVYAAVNHVQATAWRINPDVLDFVHEIEKRKGGVAGIASFEPLPLPRKPHDFDTNEEAAKRWTKTVGQIRNAEVRRQGKVGEMLAVLHMAETVESYDEIWFPFNLDFRGRLYPMTTYLHPQGNDLCRALLTFSQGKPLGESGGGWLAVHGANCLGEWQGVKMSRLTVQERANWIVLHSARIRQVAEDPWADLWWTEAEKPLQFYAFCLEWLGYLEEGKDFVSRIPISQDGTCNGLQHFAALFRDLQGGAAVNLLDTEGPEDLYQRVADTVLTRLETEAATDELAALWLASGLVDRKLCKRPTMTFAYGSKIYGFKKQIIEELQSRETWGETRRYFKVERDGEERELVRTAAGYLARLIWDALREVTQAAFDGMAWMQQGARLAAKARNLTSWTVPLTEFVVVQHYHMSTCKRVETTLAGSLVYIRVYEDIPEPLARKQANAVAPNFIHSLDAAALMLTVNECVSRGVTCFSMIHDSFATYAADSDVLADVLREQFVRLHQEPIVETLLETFEALIGNLEEEVPVPPEKGTLDLNQVLESTYFFS